MRREVRELLSGDENDAKEFKGSEVLREPDGKHKHEIAKQLVAFANSGGGHILFGVNDHGEVDAAELDEELSLGTISKIARMKCSPPVDFSYQYHPGDEFEQNGDLFIVEVEPRRSMPHAIVENSDGEIRNREFRLRAGDESRLVTDDELNWLFENRLADLGDHYKYRTWYILGKEYGPINARYERHPTTIEDSAGPEVPQGSRYLDLFVDEGPDFEAEIEEYGFPIRLPTFLVDVSPFAILASLAEHLSTSWLIEWEEKGDFGPNTIDVDKSNSTTITTEDINVNQQGGLLPYFDIDVFDILEDSHHSDSTFEVVAPSGTVIEIELPEKFPEEHSLAIVESKVIISNADLFEFEISTMMSMSGRNYPYGHPETLRESSNKRLSEIISTQINMELVTKFGAPEIQDPDLEDHQAFSQSIHEVLKHEWDADNYLQTRQENLMFEIDGKIDKLLDAIEEETEEKETSGP